MAKVGPLALSFSAINLFESCPLRFKAERIDKIKASQSEPLLVGSFLHEVTDKYIKHLLKTKATSDYAALYTLADVEWAKRFQHKDFQHLPEVLKVDIWEVLEGIKTGLLIDPAVTVGSEIELAFTRDWKKTTWLGSDVFFRGKIDRLDVLNDKTAIIWDLKTGRKIAGAEGKPQLKTYAFLVSLLLPYIEKFRVELFYPRTGALKPAEVTHAEAGEAKQWIEGISSSVEAMRLSGKWPARPGKACADCPVFDSCPERNVGARTSVVEQVVDAQRLLERYCLVDRERDEILEKLKEFVELNGPVEANGFGADFRKQDVMEWETARLHGVLRSAGYDPIPYLKGDNEALKKLARKDAAIAAEFAKIVKIRPQSRFVVAATKD